jgi:hypothetical protein
MEFAGAEAVERLLNLLGGGDDEDAVAAPQSCLEERECRLAESVAIAVELREMTPGRCFG